MVFIVHNVFKIATYPFKGLIYIIYSLISSIYEFTSLFVLGIIYVSYMDLRLLTFARIGYIFLAFIVYKIFSYAFFALKLPFIILTKNKKPKPKKIKKVKPEKIKPKKDEKKEEKKEEIIKEEKPDVKKKVEIKEKPKTETLEEKATKALLFFVKNKNSERTRQIEDESKKDKVRSAEKEKALKRKKLDSEAYINTDVVLEKPSIGKKIAGVFAGFLGIFTHMGDKFKNNSFAKNKRNRRDMKRHALLIDFEGADAVKSEKKVLYQYVAKDKNGKVIKDYFNAYSKVEVHSYLLSEGYEVYSIKTNKWIQLMHAGSNTNKTKFKTKDLIFFLTQLSTYIKAGIPLVDALRIISRQYKKKSYQKIFRSVIYELTIGENLSSAMEKQQNAFPKLLINMVKTAEMTGSLPEVLDDMAEYYSEAEATRKQMITAMTYPSIVFVFAIGVMIFVMIYVVPQFVEIYESMDTELPLITKIILNISSFLKHFWYLLILGVVLFIVLLVLSYRKITGFRAMVQYGIMHMPVFKNVVIYNEVTMFTKTFASLLAHNVPITESMEILNKITNNEIYKMLILDTITNLAKGGKISDAFKDHWAFPLPAYEMIVTGETTGELSEMMHKVSLYYQDMHKNAVTRIKTFIEPALTIFLTVGVGVILLSIIYPMFSMYSAVQDME